MRRLLLISRPATRCPLNGTPSILGAPPAPTHSLGGRLPSQAPTTGDAPGLLGIDDLVRKPLWRSNIGRTLHSPRRRRTHENTRRWTSPSSNDSGLPQHLCQHHIWLCKERPPSHLFLFRKQLAHPHPQHKPIPLKSLVPLLRLMKHL